MTILRDPVARYISEYRHVARGANWRNVSHEFYISEKRFYSRLV